MQFSVIPRTLVGVVVVVGSYLSAETRSALSTVPADWAVKLITVHSKVCGKICSLGEKEAYFFSSILFSQSTTQLS